MVKDKAPMQHEMRRCEMTDKQLISQSPGTKRDPGAGQHTEATGLGAPTGAEATGLDTSPPPELLSMGTHRPSPQGGSRTK